MNTFISKSDCLHTDFFFEQENLKQAGFAENYYADEQKYLSFVNKNGGPRYIYVYLKKNEKGILLKTKDSRGHYQEHYPYGHCPNLGYVTHADTIEDFNTFFEERNMKKSDDPFKKPMVILSKEDKKTGKVYYYFFDRLEKEFISAPNGKMFFCNLQFVTEIHHHQPEVFFIQIPTKQEKFHLFNPVTGEFITAPDGRSLFSKIELIQSYSGTRLIVHFLKITSGGRSYLYDPEKSAFLFTPDDKYIFTKINIVDANCIKLLEFKNGGKYYYHVIQAVKYLPYRGESEYYSLLERDSFFNNGGKKIRRNCIKVIANIYTHTYKYYVPEENITLYDKSQWPVDRKKISAHYDSYSINTVVCKIVIGNKKVISIHRQGDFGYSKELIYRKII